MCEKIYNKELKESYIQEVDYKNEMRILFEKTAIIEEKLGKDLCNFNLDDLRKLYESFNTNSFFSMKKYDSYIQHYIKFNREKDFNTKTTLQFLKECLKIQEKNRYLSNEEMLAILGKLENPKDKFIFRGLFEGIRGKNFIQFRNITVDKLNKKEKTILLGDGKKIKVSSELLGIAQESIDTYYYVTKDRVLRLKGEGAIKDAIRVTSSTEDNFGQNISRSFTRVKKMLNIEISPISLCESGLLHMIKTNAKEKKITPMSYLHSEYMKEVFYQYDLNEKNLAVFRHQFENFLK